MIGKKLQKALGLAVEELKRRRHEYLTLEHVLYGIASEPSGRKLIERCGGSAPVLRQALDHFFKTYMESLDEPTKDVYQTLAVQRVLDSALAHVKSAGRDEDIGVEVGDVLAAILEEEEYSWAAYCLKKQGITRLAVLESISHNDEEGQDESSSESGEGEGGAESAKDALARYTVDLTARAREGKLDPLVGREMELSRSIEILARRRKNNPLYVGDPGTGKTAIAEGLALRIVSGNVPPEFKDTKIYSLDLGAVLAGARYRGDFEGRIKAVVGALQKIPGAILFIDEIHTIVGAGSTSGGSMDASNLLKPILAEGKLRCIGSTTYDEFRNHFEKDRALARRFQKVDIKEPSLDECVDILKGLQTHYEKHHNVRYSSSSLRAAVEQVPFHCTAEARGVTKDSVYQLNTGLEQLTAVMMGGEMVEIKAVLALDFLVLQPVCEPVITGAQVNPMDMQKLQELPGIVGYIVQPDDTLWNIAKKFHTTVGNIISTNELADDKVKGGMRLLLVKEIAQP